ncbi:MAG TPA: hypothetical protein VNQ73_02500 [Ilumatobacter sp.]|nr:hypothetical protein [Ilumatobacter sp.]
MNLYRQITAAYDAQAIRPAAWHHQLGDIGTLDDIVTAIRGDHPDPTTSDAVLRRVLTIGRAHPDAITVVLYALTPRLARRLGPTATNEYRIDATANLAFVLLDSPLDSPHLAVRFVNRAHTRTHKAAQRTRRRGVTRHVTITPHDPDEFTRNHDSACPDPADAVAATVDIARFRAAIDAAIAAGTVSPTAWVAYRDHRLRRALDPDGPACNATQRKIAARATRQLQPILDAHLHAA